MSSNAEELKQVKQYGDKSFYIEENTGNIHVYSPQGEVKIIIPFSENGIKQLFSELDNQKELLEEILTIINPNNFPNELTMPPVFPTVFIGRDQDLFDLRKKILSVDSLLLLVNGHGGMGKSTLAARYYHDYKNEYKNVAWLLSEKSIATALLKLKEKLGFTTEELKMTEDEQLEIVITKLANLEKPSLVIIDNVNEVDDIQKNYLALNRCSNLHILLTTRITKFDKTPYFRVNGLSETYAMELFKKHYLKHKDEENDLLKEIIKNIDRNTLIIELLAKNLNQINILESNYTLKQLSDDLHKSLLQLSKSRKIETVYHAESQTLRVEKPEDIVLAMYKINELSDSEKQMISVFSVLPKEAISFEFLKQSFPDQDLTVPLTGLTQKGWIDFFEEDNLFKVNQVIQDVALNQQKERLFNDCKPMITKLGNHLGGEDILHNDNYLSTQLFIGYAISIVNKVIDDNETMGTLCQNLGSFHSDTGDIHLSLIVYKRMNSIFMNLHNSNVDNTDYKNGLAISYSKLGSTQTSLGNLDEALCYFEEDLKLTKELYEAYPQNVGFKNGLAISYEKLGSTQTSLGNLDEALRYFEEETKLFEELYEAYPQNVSFKNGLAISYEKLGSTQTSLGNLDEALRYFEEETKLFEELYEAYPQNVSFKNGLAISYSKLGSTQTSLGNLDEALCYFEEDLKLTKELYEAYPQNVGFKNGLAISYSKLGETQTSLGNLDEALRYFEEDTKLFEELYEAYPQNVGFKNGFAISYEKLGSTQTSLGNLDEALRYFEEETKLFEELYEAYPQNVSFKNGLAISYSKLGSTQTSLGNLDEALRYFEERSRLGKELYKAYPQNVDFKNGLAISYSKLGSTQTSLGNLDEALCYFEEDLKLTKELYEAYPQNVGFKNGLAISYSKLGETQMSLRNLDEALRYFEEDLKLTKELHEAYPQNVGFKNGLAISYAKLGVLFRDQYKDCEKAKGFFYSAKKLWQELVEQAPNYKELKKFFNQIKRDIDELERIRSCKIRPNVKKFFHHFKVESLKKER